MNLKKISGSKGGSQQPSVPWEMEDNLISINKIRVLLAVSDGECDPEFSLKDLLLNDVPVMAEDGTLNYENVKAEFRPGTQDQEYIQGFTDTASEITVQREITTSTPFNISVTNKTLSAIRIKILMPQSIHVQDNGDRVGTRVEYAVDMAVDGAQFKQVLHDVIDGKTISGYDRSRRIDLPKFNNQVILRVRRITPDSTSSNTIDRIKLQSYAEVIDAKFRYPLTGLVYVEFDSELFPNSMPNISVRKRWKLISVPSNYDPESRTYNGVWDGTFKEAWSNNPAWVLYDIIKSQRYGLDQRELGIPLDKWSLYECAKFCDELVPDGKGGTEPRYLCDMVIQSQVEAYEIIRDICSIFRGLCFWNGEALSIVVDKPRDPSYLFTNDNVINGEFSYTFASDKSLYTQCNVMFDDEQNLYQQDVEGVFEPEAAMRFGYNPTSITAIGCTRRSEANRRGRWVLKTNLKSTVVNFATGLEGMIPTVGDVVAISDNFWSSALSLNLSGRIVEVSGLQVFVPFRVDARPGDFIVVNKPDGKPIRRTIASISPDGQTINLNVGFGFEVKPDAVFAIERQDIAMQLYIVTGITRGDGDEEFTYSITAVEYDKNKYDEIDLGVNVDDRPTSVVQPDIMPMPENIAVSSYSRIVQGMSVETMVITWDKVEYASLYDVQWRKDNGNWNNVPRTASSETEVEGIYAGNYHVRVRAVSSSGNTSSWSKIVSARLSGKVGEPGAPVNIIASTDEVFGIRVKWGFAPGSGDTAYVELQQSKTGSEQDASLLSMVPYPQHEYWHSILPAGEVIWYRARTCDRIGNVSPWTNFVRGQSSTDVGEITGGILDDILNSDAMKDLQENALATSNKVKDQAQSIIQNALANDHEAKVTRVQNGKRKAEIKKAEVMIATETEARVAQINELKASVGDDISGAIKQMNEAIATEQEARSQQVNQLESKFDTQISGVNQSLQSSITEVNKTIATEKEARAEADRALQASIGQNSSAITEKLDSWANVDSIGAKYSMKLGLKYKGVEYSAGMVLSLIQSGNTVKSQMLFDADRFGILNEANGVVTLPFVVENNQVFIRSLLVQDGSITNAKIGNEISSHDYSAGKAGWMVNKNGNAEFNNATFRGTIYGESGYFNGSVYADKFVGDVTQTSTLETSVKNYELKKGELEIIRIPLEKFEQTITSNCKITFTGRGDGNVTRVLVRMPDGSTTTAVEHWDSSPRAHRELPISGFTVPAAAERTGYARVLIYRNDWQTYEDWKDLKMVSYNGENITFTRSRKSGANITFL